MSEHFSYTGLYNAIIASDINVIEKGLFYLHTNLYTTPLEKTNCALNLAASLGHYTVVDILINNDAFHSLPKSVRVKQASIALSSACNGGHYETVKTLLKSPYLTGEKQSDDSVINQYIHSAGKIGAYKIISLLLETFCQGECSVKTAIDLLYSSLNYGHCDLIQHSLVLLESVNPGNTIYSNVSPLVRAIASKDYSRIKAEIQIDLSFWWKNALVIPECIEPAFWEIGKPLETPNDKIVDTVFDLAAAIGDERLFSFLYEAAGVDELCDKTTKRDFTDILESSCDVACSRGRLGLVKLLLDTEWIDTEYNKKWCDRLRLSMRKRRTDVALLILDTFYDKTSIIGPNIDHCPQITSNESTSKHGRITSDHCVVQSPETMVQSKAKIDQSRRTSVHYSPNISDLCDDLDTYPTDKYAIMNNDPKLANKILKCIKKISSNEEEFQNYLHNRLRVARHHGLQEIINIYQSFGAREKRTGRHCWCQELVWRSRQSMVTIENQEMCPCGKDILTKCEINVPIEGQYQRFCPRWMLEFLLRQDRGDNFDPKVLTNQIGCKTILPCLDFIDAEELTDTIPFLPRLESDIFDLDEGYNFREFCHLFQVCCGSSISELLWNGIFIHIYSLDNDEIRDFICSCMAQSGIHVHDNTLQFVHELVKSEKFTRVLKLSSPTCVSWGLKSLCRVRIRQTVRTCGGRVFSLTDRLTSLVNSRCLPRTQVNIDGYLPKSMVDFLLFRNVQIPQALDDLSP